MLILENLINKGGLRSSLLRRIRDHSKNPPDILWSRGWSHFADHAGDGSFLYPAYPTRYCVDNLRFLRGKSGLIWIRSGSYPIREDWGVEHESRLGDIATFARDAIGRLADRTVLVTTDGDMSVPGDLPAGVANKILDDPNIVAWFTQNYDRSITHPKLKPVPIGLGFHALPSRFAGISQPAKQFCRSIRNSTESEERLDHIWSDTHINLHPRSNVRKHPTQIDPRALLAEALGSAPLRNTVDTPNKRIPYSDLWDRYSTYKYIVSLPGHGWDCYRTWEALGLGATVITVHSPLDNLLSPYRVIFIDAKKPEDWLILNDRDWLASEFEKCKLKPIPPLSWDHWITTVRRPLRPD